MITTHPDDRTRRMPPAGELTAPTDEHEAVERYAWLAETLARRFYVRTADRADLRQVAMVGLVMASRRYDDSRGVSFRSYATRVILGHLKHHFRDHRWTVGVRRSVKDDWVTVRRATDILTQELGRSPSIAQVADFASMSEDRVRRATEAGETFRTIPISAPTGASADGTLELPATDRSVDRVDLSLTLRAALQRLKESDRELVELAVFDGLTQMQIADRLGVSQMTVSRRLRAVYERLAAWLLTTDAA